MDKKVSKYLPVSVTTEFLFVPITDLEQHPKYPGYLKRISKIRKTRYKINDTSILKDLDLQETLYRRYASRNRGSSMSKTKAILRYPGGKTKAIRYIKPYWEQVPHLEYREPFVGGGSVFIAKPQTKHDWINDIDDDLIALFKILADDTEREKLIDELLSLEISKELYDELFESKVTTDYEKAKRYYVINRCSFSGITKWNAFIGDVRYNIKNAQSLMRVVGKKLKSYKITSLDFEKVITAKPVEDSVFMFLDPPYYESRQVVAYTHSFKKEDHIRLSDLLKRTNHQFLLTYDDCEFIRDLYEWAHQEKYSWTYSVANSSVHHNPREKGNELFISNYKLKEEIQSKISAFL